MRTSNERIRPTPARLPSGLPLIPASVPDCSQGVAPDFPKRAAVTTVKPMETVGTNKLLREESRDLIARLSSRAQGMDVQLRRAALNLLEDTEQARRAEEEESAARELAEEAEQATERRYRSLFETIDEGFCVIKVIFDGQQRAVDYVFLEVNPAFERHSGIPNALGRRMRQIAPEHEEFWFEAYGRVALTGESNRFEYSAKQLGRHYDVHASRVGEPEQGRVAVLFNDITERKRREANLAFLADISQDLVKLTQIDETIEVLGAKIGNHFHASPCAFSEVDEAQQTLTIRHEWKRPEAASLKGVYRIADYHTPEFRRAARAGETYVVRDAATDPRLDSAHVAALGIGAFVSVPLVRNGEWRFNLHLYDCAPRDWQENEIDLLRELTTRVWIRLERSRAEKALLESQARLRLVMDNAREYAIVSMDLERRITSWNDGAHRIVGYSEMEALGQSADLLFTPEDRAEQAPEQEAEKGLATGRASDERWHLRKDGSRFWGSGVMTAMRDSTGVAIGLVKIFRDYTEQRLAKQALEESLAETRQAQAEAEAAGRAKDHFLAVLSHELRTPLTPVLLATELIESNCGEDAMVHQALEMIRRNVGIEARFIKDLLDVTRIGHGKFEISPAPLDVHAVIRRVVENVKPEFDEKDQQLTVKLEAVETTISGDDDRLEQVACNLLKNASKFTPEEGRIEVRTFNEDGCLVLEVTDSGIGIDPAEQSLIFDAFAQANQSISQKFGGLGLGLAIAKAIVEGHGGELHVHSRGRGHGATFCVRLPLLRYNGITPEILTCVQATHAIKW